MPRMTGGDLISDFLIEEEVPYVFGICGHGNVLPRRTPAGGDTDFVRPGIVQPGNGHRRRVG
jgi:hypothetical protein